MYENQKALRQAAIRTLESRGYRVEILRGGGSRLRLTKGDASQVALVRTSSDRWVGWMRDAGGQWRGMGDGELVVVAAISATPGTADIYALRPEDVRAAFDTNLAAREAAMPSLKKTAPIFVSLDADNRQVPVAAGAGVGLKALWHVEAVLNRPGVVTSSATAPTVDAPPSELRLTISEAKAALARTFGVSPDAIRITIEG